MSIRMIGLACVLVVLAAATAALAAGETEVGDSAALKAALLAANPGDRIVVRPGRYEQLSVAGVHGRHGELIQIIAKDPNDLPIFDGAGKDPWGFAMTDCAYILIDGLVATGAKRNNFELGYADSHGWGGVDHIIVRNLHSRHVAGTGNNDGIKMTGVTDFLFENCSVESWSGEGSAMDMVACARGLIANCHFSYPDVKGANAKTIQSRGGSYHLGVFRCRFDESNHRTMQFGGSADKQFFLQGNLDSGWEGLDMVAIGNVITGAESAVCFVSCTRCLFAYNTVVKQEDYVIRVLKEGGTHQVADNTFQRNLVVYEKLSGTVLENGGGDLATFTFSDNYWYNANDPGQSIPQLAVRQDNPAGGQYPQLDQQFKPAPGSPAAAYGAFAPEVDRVFAEHRSKFEWAYQQYQAGRAKSASQPSASHPAGPAAAAK
jgi:hypothetical protein